MIKQAKQIDVETLASIIRQGILNGSVSLVGHQYLQVIVKLLLYNSGKDKDFISFKESGNGLKDFMVSDKFYGVLKKKDPDLYKYLTDPYLIMKDLKVDVSKVIVNCLNEIVRVLRAFKSVDDIMRFLTILNTTSEGDIYIHFKEIKAGEVNYAEMISDRFFRDVIEKLEQDSSSIIETVKQTFLQLVYDNIAEIKLYTERNYYVNLHSVMGTGIVYKIYVAINNAKDTFKPFVVVPYDVSESDLVSYALQTLRHTGNFGIAVKILDTAFVVVVPSNRLDIVKC